MALYEYQCNTDGIIQITHKITEPAVEVCPICGGPIKRIISSSSFHLKGDGWYVTDYAKKETKK